MTLENKVKTYIWTGYTGMLSGLFWGTFKHAEPYMNDLHQVKDIWDVYSASLANTGRCLDEMAIATVAALTLAYVGQKAYAKISDAYHVHKQRKDFLSHWKNDE